jgi:phosphoribosylformylglycinamidine synthase
LAGYGFNADAELCEAFRLAGAEVERVQLSDLLTKPEAFDHAAILAFPGGFSFGDHLGSGKVVALLFRRYLDGKLRRFISSGGLVIGICNGFQVLTKLGILPGGSDSVSRREVTLIRNESGRFIDDWVDVRFERTSACLWTRGLADRMLPVRHGEGRFVTKDEATLDRLESEGLVALRYAADSNPNGSARDIAGICDSSGRVFGLMPHPEAFLVPENHPLRRRSNPGTPGIDLFENGVRVARESA